MSAMNAEPALEDDGLQVDFMATIHGVRSFEGVRDRASVVAIAGEHRADERSLVDLIRRWQALPPHRRTNFLRKRLGPGRSAL